MKHVAIASVISLVENYKTKNNHSNFKKWFQKKKNNKVKYTKTDRELKWYGLNY